VERARAPLVLRRTLAEASDVARMTRRLAHQIVEKNRGVSGLALVGIRTGGLTLARRLVQLIAEAEGRPPLAGAVDIALYRDDVADRVKPAIGPTELPFTVEGTRIVLVDDVLYTGRTVRAALDALVDYGRPRSVQLAVLVDRGHRELPIQADFVGMTAATERDERVTVTFTESGDGGAATDAVKLFGPAETTR
jgi:pyrimidine operon attenuation protein / uracil phosphoribosyltransferase